VSRLADKQASRRPYFGQLSKQRKGLLACLLIYCLYIVNLVVAVVGNRPLVFLVAKAIQMVQISSFRQPLSLFKIFFRANLKSRVV